MPPKQQQQTVSIAIIEPSAPGTSLTLATNLLESFQSILATIAGHPAGPADEYRLTDYSRGQFTIAMPPAHIAAATTVADALTAANTDDRNFAKALDQLTIEALATTSEMIAEVTKAEATLAIVTPTAEFKFESLDHAWVAVHNMSPEHISESEAEIKGHFAGFLPTPRRAEYFRSQPKDTIYANVDAAIADPSAIFEIIGKPTIITLNARTVGDAPTRYLIKPYAKDSD